MLRHKIIWLCCLALLLLAVDSRNATAQEKSAAKTIVLIGHGPDHPYRTHCYLPDCELLAKCLRQTSGVRAIVSRGWPKDEKLLQSADAIVLHVRMGGDLLFHPTHREQAAKLLERGIGLTAVHWGTGGGLGEVGDRWLKALGGHFNTKFSRYRVEQSTMHKATPDHPISRGWHDYPLRDEFYYRLKFMPGATPIATAKVAGKEYAIGWAYQRPDSKGRSFGFVAGHFHDNFGSDPFRRTLVNGILWTAGVEIPREGAPCQLEENDLQLPAEFEKLNPRNRSKKK